MSSKQNIALILAALLAACGGGTDENPPPEIPPVDDTTSGGEVTAEPSTEREAPPASEAPRDIAFPPVVRSTVGNGLELDVVAWNQLPVVYLELVIKSGSVTDPDNIPGLASLVADMLREGTRTKSSAELAEAIDYLGAQFGTHAESDQLRISMRVVASQLPEALALLTEIVTSPAFSEEELAKLKRRERDRLALSAEEPDWLAARAYYRTLYGNHPYARTDTTPEAAQRVTRRDLQSWHRTHVVPGNAFLMVVGDVNPEEMKAAAGRAFARWRGRAPTARVLPAPPQRTAREVLIVDRPGSVQSIIQIGNLAMPRNAADWIKMRVANQVLGGGAASRLFMDLRERRSLTYGAYSDVDERVQIGAFTASSSVRTEVTAEAVAAFFEHLGRITDQAPEPDELRNSARFLSDSFPLRIDTPGRIASLVADLRVFGLPDDYWQTYRSAIQAVTPEEAVQTAHMYIKPETAAVVIVGEAARFEEALRAYGRVTVVSADGRTLRTLEPSRPE
jgi:zinc protease